MLVVIPQKMAKNSLDWNVETLGHVAAVVYLHGGVLYVLLCGSPHSLARLAFDDLAELLGSHL